MPVSLGRPIGSRRSPGQNPCPLLEKHGGIWRFDENKTGQTQRTADAASPPACASRAFTWHDGALYVVKHNRDQLDTLWPKHFTAKQNAELPGGGLAARDRGVELRLAVLLSRLAAGKRVQNPEYGGDGKKEGDCAKYRRTRRRLPRPLGAGGLLFYTGSQFPAKYRGGAFIAFQGSWNRAPRAAGRLQRDVPADDRAEGVGSVRGVRGRLRRCQAADEA